MGWLVRIISKYFTHTTDITHTHTQTHTRTHTYTHTHTHTHTHTNTDTHTLFKGRVRAFLMHEKNAEIVKPTELSFFNFNVVLFQ